MSRQQIYVSADAVVFVHHSGETSVLLVRRKQPPFKDMWCLPGGFVGAEEELEAAAIRELEEETGLKIEAMTQLQAFGRPGRDPRQRTISIAFFAELDELPDVAGGDDAAEAGWHPVPHLPELGFDHGDIVRYALRRLQEGAAR